MSLVEALVSSALLSMIVVSSTRVYTNALLATRRAMAIDRAGVANHADNERVRHQVSMWRHNGDYGLLSYDVSEEDCRRGLANVMLEEIEIKTTGTPIAQGNLLYVKKTDGVSPLIYLPQHGWCP